MPKTTFTSKKLKLKPTWRSPLRLANFVLLFAIVGVLFLAFSRAATLAGFYGSVEQDQVNRINNARASAGKAGLQHIECLNAIAELWTKKMADAGGISHNPNLKNEVTYACNNSWSVLGENVGVGYDSLSLFNAFMNSPGHKANILDSRFTKTGLGAYKTTDGRLWVTQVFAKCVSCGGSWSTNATLPADPVPIKVSGRVYNETSGAGIANVTIETCTGNNPKTDANGNWSVTMDPEKLFCLRAASGGPDTTTWGGPIGSANNPEYASSPSYEWQVAGKSCYHVCGGSYYNWDRNSDTGYDFKYSSPRARRIFVDGSGKGYVLDSFGKIWPLGGAPLNNSPTWKGWHIANAMTVNPDLTEAYFLDGWGGVHPVGSAPRVNSPGYWSGWDIARDLVITDWSSHSGMKLDGFGGLHKFGSNPPKTDGHAYWSGSDTARRAVSAPGGGYTLRSWGSVHPFGTAKKISKHPYWQNADVAVDLEISPDGTKGYVLDYSGGIHSLTVEGYPATTNASGGPYWAGQKVAVDMVITDWSVPKGYVLDFKGGIHPFGGAINVSGGPYWR